MAIFLQYTLVYLSSWRRITEGWFWLKKNLGVVDIIFSVFVLFFASRESLQILPSGLRSLGMKGQPVTLAKGLTSQMRALTTVQCSAKEIS
jgi:hypothetical protein